MKSQNLMNHNEGIKEVDKVNESDGDNYKS